MHRFFDGLRPTLNIAHRGGAAIAPENTLVAFRRAVEEFGAPMLETDVHVSRDREVVISHDPTVERCTDGAGAIAQLTLPELQRFDAGFRFSRDGGRTFPFRGQGVRLPALREVLRALPNVRLNIDLKESHGDDARTLAELLRAEKAVERVCVGSELDEVAARLHDALPEGCHFYPRNALAAFVLTLKSGDEPPDDPRFSVLDMPLYFEGTRLIDPVLLQTAHRLRKWINVWTVDDPAEMRRCVIEGVGGVMTDRPDLMRDVLASLQ